MSGRIIVGIIFLILLSSVSFSETEEVQSPLFRKSLEISKKSMIKPIEIKKNDKETSSKMYPSSSPIFTGCPSCGGTSNSNCTSSLYICETQSAWCSTSESNCTYTSDSSCPTTTASCYPDPPTDFTVPEYDDDGVFTITWSQDSNDPVCLYRNNVKTNTKDTLLSYVYTTSYRENVSPGLYIYELVSVNDNYSGYYSSAGEKYCFVKTPEKIPYQDWTTTDTWHCWSGIDSSPKPNICEFTQTGMICKWPSIPLPQPGFFQILKSSPTQSGLDYFIPYYENSIYIVKLRMSAGAHVHNPQIRIRVQSADNVWTACGHFAGDGAFTNQGGAPGKYNGNFYFVYQPQGSTAPAFLAVDVFNGNGCTGQISIAKIEVYTMPIATSSLAYIYNDFSSWTKIGDDVTTETNKIIFHDTDSWVLTGSYIKMGDQIVPDNIYRIGYYLNKDASGLFSDALRLRVADSKNGSYISTFSFNDRLAGANGLTTNGKYYYLYHWAANTRNTVLNSDLTVSMDELELYPNNGADTILSKIHIDNILMPPVFP